MPQEHQRLDINASNIHSQFGEDGILQAILKRLPPLSKWAVEFGAWDGKYMSNTRALREREQMSVVYIEGDRQRFNALRQAHLDDPRIVPIHAFVGFGSQDNLDAILATTACPCEFDVLSIDIDGNDYHTWKSARIYRPKIVVIEYNPTIPEGVEYIQPADPHVNVGSSIESLVRLGASKGYFPIAVTEGNIIFVSNELGDLFQEFERCYQKMMPNQRYITHLFFGYDGSLHIAGHGIIPWQALELDEKKMQVIPRMLQGYPGPTGWVKRALRAIWRRSKGLIVRRGETPKAL